MKRFFIIFGIVAVYSFNISYVKADRNGFVKTVVIDPGHGGRDPGSVGRKSKEKDIALAISLQLGQLINEHLPDVKVIYTRTTDVFVEFHKRTEIANKNHADLFISVHINGAADSRAFGTETFVMGLHVSQANLEVAKKENAAILFEDDYLERYGGYDPNSPEANIIFSLYQNAHLEQSLQMASLVQHQFRDRARRQDRGVKQAGFLVLYGVTMPGVLIEAGFITNPREEEYLISREGQSHLASAIFRAFRDYKTQQDALAAARLERVTASGQSLMNAAPTKPDQAQSSQIQLPQTVAAPPTPVMGNTLDIVFKVQFATTTDLKPSGHFAPLQAVEYYLHDGLFKYTVGAASTFEEAAQLQRQVQQSGFKDAFVVAFLDNQRITPAEAIRLLNSRDKQ